MMIKESPSAMIPIEYVFPSDVPTRFANTAIVQSDHGTEYRISFFEIEPPLALGDQDEQMEQLKRLDKIQARCVARIVLSSGRMPDIVTLFMDQLKANHPKAFEQVLKKFLPENE
jgi:hypothetical protein